MTMTILAMPAAAAFVESPDNGKASSVSSKSSNPSNICVGTRLRIKRTARGVCQPQLSSRLGIEHDDLGAYEAGAKRISDNLLLRIAKFLDVRPDYFFQDYSEEELANCLHTW